MSPEVGPASMFQGGGRGLEMGRPRAVFTEKLEPDQKGRCQA